MLDYIKYVFYCFVDFFCESSRQQEQGKPVESPEEFDTNDQPCIEKPWELSVDE